MYNKNMKNFAIILASGTGSRLGNKTPKQFIKLNDKYIFEYSLKTFNNHINIDEIVLVCHPEYLEFVKSYLRNSEYTKVKRIIAGGNTRQESVSNGIFSISYEEGNVLVHDSARPFVTTDMITRVIEELGIYNAVSTVMPATDTIFEIDESSYVTKIPSRKNLRIVQTPQGFNLNTIRKAHLMAQKDNQNLATDDCSLILKYQLSEIKTVDGDDLCFKITTSKDLFFAESLLNNGTILNPQ